MNVICDHGNWERSLLINFHLCLFTMFCWARAEKIRLWGVGFGAAGPNSLCMWS